MFKGINSLIDLSLKLVETKRGSLTLVFLLIKLELLLPVAITSLERILSTMTSQEYKLRNEMADSLLDDCLVTFIE
jgi:hypothetical protein